MNRQASVLFKIMFSSSSGVSSALQGQIAQRSFYQQLICSSLTRSIHTSDGIQLLGRQLADVSHHAYFAKQIETVNQASRVMLALPISSELTGVARYYQAICAKRKGDIEEARQLLERARVEAPAQYRARALHVIATIYHEQGDIDEALPFYAIAAKTAGNCDPLTLVGSQSMIAIIRSLHGDHKQALDDLERLFPLVRAISKRYPALFCDYLNSLAVELGEVGRIDEAEAACAITLASPFCAAYPNWSETRDELQAKRASATPSIVSIGALPAPAPSPRPALNQKPALAFICLARKNAFIQTSNAIALTAIARVEISRDILERVRRSIHPRAPPACF
jgi:tetratricopeptide (TPR) repeat protein